MENKKPITRLFWMWKLNKKLGDLNSSAKIIGEYPDNKYNLQVILHSEANFKFEQGINFIITKSNYNDEIIQTLFNFVFLQIQRRNSKLYRNKKRMKNEFKKVE